MTQKTENTINDILTVLFFLSLLGMFFLIAFGSAIHSIPKQ
jgi:hypothetical protein